MTKKGRSKKRNPGRLPKYSRLRDLVKAADAAGVAPDDIEDFVTLGRHVVLVSSISDVKRAKMTHGKLLGESSQKRGIAFLLIIASGSKMTESSVRKRLGTSFPERSVVICTFVEYCTVLNCKRVPLGSKPIPE